jgi:hypothetical protein
MQEGQWFVADEDLDRDERLASEEREREQAEFVRALERAMAEDHQRRDGGTRKKASR